MKNKKPLYRNHMNMDRNKGKKKHLKALNHMKHTYDGTEHEAIVNYGRSFARSYLPQVNYVKLKQEYEDMIVSLKYRAMRERKKLTAEYNKDLKQKENFIKELKRRLSYYE